MLPSRENEIKDQWVAVLFQSLSCFLQLSMNLEHPGCRAKTAFQFVLNQILGPATALGMLAQPIQA